MAVGDSVLGDVLVHELLTVKWTALCGDRTDDVELVKFNLQPIEDTCSFYSSVFVIFCARKNVHLFERLTLSASRPLKLMAILLLLNKI